MEDEKPEEYRFEKRILQEIRGEGYILGSLETGMQTGYFFDKDYRRMRKGSTLIRTVMKVGDHTVWLRRKRDPNVHWGKYVFIPESTGFIKDIQAMDEYSFKPGDDITVRMKVFRQNGTIRINLKRVGRSW